MVVALCGELAGDDQARGTLAQVLGADAVSATRVAAELLADPHPLVAAGAGLWTRPAYETARIKQWRAGLGAVVDTGDIPTQERIDRWAAERTLGLIERFPIQLDPEVVCLLASALATKVSWEVPFAVVDAAELGPSPWSTHLHRVLRTPKADPRDRQYFAHTDRAGTVSVHLTGARGGLLVGSVIAADRAVRVGDVLATAEQIVTAEARRARPGRIPKVGFRDRELRNHRSATRRQLTMVRDRQPGMRKVARNAATASSGPSNVMRRESSRALLESGLSRNSRRSAAVADIRT
jgi:hypothetical protein